VRKLLVLPAIAVAGLVLGGAGGARNQAVSETLHAVVGPDFRIGLSFDDGSPVTNLPAGTYTVQVSDRSGQHNFHLIGPGVDQKTEIATESEASWTVTFQDQNGYTFQCDAHSSLTGNFTVGNLPAPPPVTTHDPAPSTTVPPPAEPTLPLRGTLQATLGPKLAVSLLKSGKSVKKLPRGIYTFAIADRSKQDGFTIRQVVGGSFEQALTAASFVGKRTVQVALGPGKWKLYSGTRETSISTFFDVS
jgi:hypothetical protein